MIDVDEVTESALDDVARAIWLADNPEGDWSKLVRWSQGDIDPSGLTMRDAKKLQNQWQVEVTRYRQRAQAAIVATLCHIVIR